MSKFIVVEGIDGSGKTTLVESLSEAMRSRGLEVITTREPGGSKRAEEIRTLLLSDEGKNLSATEQFELVHEGRIDHIENLIKPALRQGTVVISDRFELSSWVYQVWPDIDGVIDMYKRHEKVVAKTLGDYDPHYLVMNLDTDSVQKRLANVIEKNHFDATEKEIIDDRLAAYARGVKEVRGIINHIDASESPDLVLESALKSMGY